MTEQPKRSKTISNRCRSQNHPKNSTQQFQAELRTAQTSPPAHPLQALLQRILPHPHPHGSIAGLVGYKLTASPLLRSNKTDLAGTKDEGIVNNIRGSWDPASVVPSPASLDLGQSCGSAVQCFQLVLLSFLGEISLFSSIFPWHFRTKLSTSALPAQLDYNNSAKGIMRVFSNQQI